MEEYEDKYWSMLDQVLVFRHKAAIDMVERGKILDIGCGDGLFLKMLSDKKMIVEGVDHSDQALSKARIKGLNVQKCDFAREALPYNDNEFDYVTILDVLEHVYSPELLLAEAKRVTKKHIIISVPNFSSLPARLQVVLGRVPENNMPRKGHIYWFNYPVLKNLLKNNSLEIEEIRTNTIWRNKIFFGSFFHWLTKLFPNIFALSFVVCCRK